MSVITVVAKLAIKEGHLEAVHAELLKLIEPTRQENGCLEYRLHQDNNDPAVFIFYENWQNMACLESHMRSPHFNAYVAAVDGKLDKEVNLLTEVG